MQIRCASQIQTHRQTQILILMQIRTQVWFRCGHRRLTSSSLGLCHGTYNFRFGSDSTSQILRSKLGYKSQPSWPDAEPEPNSESNKTSNYTWMSNLNSKFSKHDSDAPWGGSGWMLGMLAPTKHSLPIQIASSAGAAYTIAQIIPHVPSFNISMLSKSHQHCQGHHSSRECRDVDQRFISRLIVLTLHLQSLDTVRMYTILLDLRCIWS